MKNFNLGGVESHPELPLPYKIKGKMFFLTCFSGDLKFGKILRILTFFCQKKSNFEVKRSKITRYGGISALCIPFSK